MFAKSAYLYLLRFPILVGVLLFLFPIAAVFSPLNPLVENLFDLDGIGTFLVTLLALITSWSVLLTSRLVLVNGHTRFDTPPAGKVSSLSARHVWWVLLLASPAVFVQFTRLGRFLKHDADGHLIGLSGVLVDHGIAIVAGLVIAYFLAYFGLYLAVLFAPAGTQEFTAQTFPAPLSLRRYIKNADTKDPFGQLWKSIGPWLNRHIGRRFGPGFLDNQGYPLSGVWLSLLFASITFAVYQSIDIYKRATFGESPNSIPAFVFVLFLFLNANWTLSFLAFLLDRWRIPLIVPFLILFALAWVVPYNDHYFEVFPGATIRPISPAAVMNRRLDLEHNEGRRIVVVASAGGGIQAAAWTAKVLAGLQQDSLDAAPLTGKKPSDFASDLTAVSSVSGGAVGSMYFLNQYKPDVKGFSLPKNQLFKLVDMASGRDLDNIAWALVYHDIPRLYEFFTINQKLDRGYLLEQAWSNRGNINEMLSKWQEGVLDGWRPVTIFNSTFAESGEPLLFSTSQIADPGFPHRWDFSREYRLTDIRVATAVRLASTFPFVSPAARASMSNPKFHVVDGGYFDDYGVASLMEWLREAFGGNVPTTKVLFVQILSFPADSEDAPRRNKSAFFQLYAPVKALFGVRSTSQLIRDRDELDELKSRWGCHLVWAPFRFEGTGAPLSWQMNQAQRTAIDIQWQGYTVDQDPTKPFLTVRRFLRGEDPPCPAK